MSPRQPATTDTENPPMTADNSDRAIRKSTKLEIGLALLLAGQFGGAVWWARGVSGQLDTLTQAVAKYDPGANAVLVYRVEQLERTNALLDQQVQILQAQQARRP
jgi:hypothetical protein